MKISNGSKILILLIIMTSGLFMIVLYWWAPILGRVEELENRLADLEIRATRTEVALEQNNSFDKVRFLDELRNKVLEETMIFVEPE